MTFSFCVRIHFSYKNIHSGDKESFIPYNIFISTVRCHYNVVNFLQILSKYIPCIGGMYFVSSYCYLYSASFTAVMYTISCYIGPRYSDFPLFVVKIGCDAIRWTLCKVAPIITFSARAIRRLVLYTWHGSNERVQCDESDEAFAIKISRMHEHKICI